MRAVTLIVPFVLALAACADAQQAPAVGLLGRARVCDTSSGSASSGTRIGRVVAMDSQSVTLAGKGWVDRVSLDDVVTLDTMVRRERNLRSIGTLIGMVVGPMLLAGSVHAAEARTDGQLIFLVPASVLAGIAAGYFVGDQASAEAVWQQVSLPTHRAGCP